MKTLLAWHFSALDQRLRFGDGRRIVAGETLSVSTPIKVCKHGLHASEDIMDALDNAPGPYIWRVELSGEMVSSSDQVAAEHRKALWGFDATDVLRRFARLCALDVVHLWDAPAVVREYLETGREDISEAAWSEAESFAGWAAEPAAEWAAWSVAELAGRSMAGSAGLARAAAEPARSAARLAAAAGLARSALESALNAEKALREKQRVRLEEMIGALYTASLDKGEKI